MISAFSHLHAHSYFSLLEGLTAPEELVQAAVTAGMPALALTDHRCLSGVVEFVEACQKSAIQPLIGLEVDVQWQGNHAPLVLMATETAGWSNLCRLSSGLLLEESSGAGLVLGIDVLAAHTQGLLVLTGGQRSLLDRFSATAQQDRALDWLNSLGELFPQRVYVELQQHTPEQEVLARRVAGLAKQAGLPVVATQDIYYLHPDQAELQRTLSAMRLNTRIKDLPEKETAPQSAYFATAKEMQQRFAWIAEALENISTVAESCRFELPLGEMHFPAVPLPPGKTAAQVLRQKAETGAKRRYGKITPIIRERLEHELEIIARRGYEPIFLIVEELLQFAAADGVPVSSRGSAASSLVAYCLGITNPDPLALNLYFERFLNPARSTPPDIDTDLCSRRRERVIRHVFETYGTDRVAMVGTINRFRPRSALGEVAKAHGITPAEVRQLVNALPHFFHPQMQTDEEKENPFGGLAAAYPRHQVVFEQAQALLRQPRHLSMHPGGILVAPQQITDLVPVMRSGGKGVTITQFDLESVERFGLVKIDLLGIRGLTVLGDVAEAIYSWRRSEFRSPMQVLAAVPLDDPETAEKVRTAQTIGCFQIESPGMRATLRDIQAHTRADVMAALALYRPGPLRGGLRDAFVRRFKGLEPVDHLHPLLEPLLTESYGVILYQEQVLRIAHELGGLSLTDADLLRRAMSHFDPGEQMKTLRRRFLEGSHQRGVAQETAERVWEMMAAFAGYGFPKAHAASYAQVAWQGAWCKTHFPAEFICAVLANGGGYYSQRVYLSEARRMGLTVRPPHINHSCPSFRVSYPQGLPVLYMGLDQVYGLTYQTQKQIMAKRPFTSLDDFLVRVDPRKTEVENLVRCGAMDGLGRIPVLLSALKAGVWHKGQPALFERSTENEKEWSLTERAQAQEEVLGVSVDVHPLELYVPQIAAAGAISMAEAVGRMGESLVVAGMRITSRRTRTQKGETMLFLSLEDLEGMLEVVFFPQIYQQYRQHLRGSGPYLIRGTLEWDVERGEPWLRAEKVRNLAGMNEKQNTYRR